MKQLSVFSIFAALLPLFESKKSSPSKQDQFSRLWNQFVQQVILYQTEIILFSILFAILGLIIYDIVWKSKVKRLLEVQKESAKQIVVSPESSPTEVIAQMNQVYLKRQNTSGDVRNNTEFPIYKIVITGGPCGGKTTSLDRMRKEMSERGFRVFSVPEIPTMVVVAGGMILMSKFSTQEKIKFQSELIKFQMYAEDYFTKLAEMSKSPSIILCDRGTVDPYAYISKEEFQSIMDQEGWSWVNLRDRRYDRVIFLDSAAVGAEDFYTRSNNTARSEGIEVAKALNQKTLDGWTGHPQLSIITNRKGETFDDKISRAVKAVEQTVGLEQVNISHEKLLIKAPVFPANVKFESTEIQEGFLVNNDPRYEEDKIKKRTQNNSSTYQRKYQTKRNQNGDYAQEIRKPLTALQYVTLKEQSLDPQFKVVQRKRIHFAYNSIPFAIDIYDEINGEKNVHLLRFNSEIGGPNCVLPDFLKVIKDVKKDKSYSLREIARKK